MVASLAATMCGESPRFSQRNISAAHIETILEALMKSDRAFVRVYETSDKGVTGIMVGAMAPYLFNVELYAADLILYVKPEARGSRAAIALVDAFEKWAKTNGAIEVILGTSTGIEMEKTACFYERIGYSLVSKGFAKGLQ